MSTLDRLYEIDDAPTAMRIEKLHPVIRQLVVDTVLAAKARGVEIRITYGLRTFDEQNRIWQKGRDAAGNKIGPTVTNARGGQSYHNYGLAVDFILRHKDGSVSYNYKEDMDKDGKADWDEVIEEFKARGFSWGGDWDKIVDRPHVEFIPQTIRNAATKTKSRAWQVLRALYDKHEVDAEGYVKV